MSLEGSQDGSLHSVQRMGAAVEENLNDAVNDVLNNSDHGADNAR